MHFDFLSFISGSLLSLLISALINHRLTLVRGKEERKVKVFNEAAQTIRDAFAPEMTILQSTNTDVKSIYQVLIDALPRHESAYISFRQHLQLTEIPCFEEAWSNYLYPEGEPHNAPNPFCDYISDCNETAETEYRLIALIKINIILSFARLK